MVGFIQGTRQKEEHPLGAALGQGVSQGISSMLGEMLEDKQHAKLVNRQKEQWKPVAKAYAEATGRPQLTKLFEDLGPVGTEMYNLHEKQQADQAYRQAQSQKLGAEIENLLAQSGVYKNFLQGNAGELGFNEMPENRPIPKATRLLGAPEGQFAEPMEEIIQEKITKRPEKIPSAQPKLKINGIEFDKAELPKRKVETPPIGILGTKAKIEAGQNQQNRNKIEKYMEPYANTSDLKKQEKKLLEAEKIIETQNIGNTFSNMVTAILEESHPSIAEYAKTPAQRKLWHLLYDSLRPKELGGSNPSTKEVLLSRSRLPLGIYGKEADEYIIKSMINDVRNNIQKSKTMHALNKYDPNMNFSDFQSIIEKKFSDFEPEELNQKEVNVYDPEGNLYGTIDRSEIDQLPEGYTAR